jgi:hypothetical protein
MNDPKILKIGQINYNDAMADLGISDMSAPLLQLLSDPVTVL